MSKIFQRALPCAKGNPADRPAYLMLISVLIVSAIMTGIVVSITFWGTDQTRSALLGVQASQAKALANACAEQALQYIRSDVSYSGSGNLSLTGGTCSYTVINAGGANFTINATGTAGNAIRKIEILISQVNPQINITSWQEVADF